MGPKKRTGTKVDSHRAVTTIRVMVDCHNSPDRLYFDVEPQLPVNALVEQVLERLAVGENADHVNTMRQYYSPVLELLQDGNATPLSNNDTIQQSGITDQSLCRIAAKPRKERIMFCRKP